MRHGRAYRFAQFARDRLVYVLLFLACSACVIAIALLGIVPQQGSYRTASMGYLFLLMLFFLLAALVIDYRRQAEFYRMLEQRLETESVDALSALAPGITREQQLVVQALERQHRRTMDLLEQYRTVGERRRLFTDQWVHQIKTPVSVIDLLTQDNRLSEEEPGLSDRLPSIREENERIKGYLELVLHDARLEQFEHDVHVGRVALFPLLRSVVNRHKTSFIRAELYPSLTGDEAVVVTDEKWLIFVLNQILSNAVKYSRLRSGSKQLRLHISQSPYETRLSISDEGIGIPEQDLPRVLEPFFTGENGRKTGESTGMGLYLAHQVCSKLGHPLSVESTAGAGTTVTILFTGQGIHCM
ncbi:sensor histidine kinase [Paenibacillus filicis]|uniref:histidine kinase n=1 Tax=Paenibacillus filicis TaxID=669464 RepID=A0ABU9DHP7_9BACL